MNTKSVQGWNYQPVLKTLSDTLIVDRMMLYSEINRLPLLLVKISIEGEQAIPILGDKLELSLQNAEGTEIQIGQTRNWFVDSITRLPSRVGPQQQLRLMLLLTALPGQRRPMSSYVRDAPASDEGLSVSDIVQGACERFVDIQLSSEGGAIEDILLDNVVSVGETVEQFLRRLAEGVDHWFVLQGGADSGSAKFTWLPLLKAGEVFEARQALCVETHTGDSGQVYQYPQRIRFKPSETGKSISDAKTGPFCAEFIHSLPVGDAVHAKRHETDEQSGIHRRRFFLGDAVEMAEAWPGMGIKGGDSEDDVVLGVLQVFDAQMGNVGALYRALPGVIMSDSGILYPEKLAGHFGVLVLAGRREESYLGTRRGEDRFGLRNRAAQVADALGFPIEGFSDESSPFSGSKTAIATVQAWDEASSATWAAGSRSDGVRGHISQIKVRFDWSSETIRVPFVHPMNGDDGLVFMPPSAGDRVFVLFDSLWPLGAMLAWQYADVTLADEFNREATADNLGAPRGAILRGGMLLKTLRGDIASDGDIVLHAAGDLVLCAEGSVIVESLNRIERVRTPVAKMPTTQDGIYRATLIDKEPSENSHQEQGANTTDSTGGMGGGD